MHPSNLVIYEVVSVANGHKSPLISDIQDGEQYLCALKHYNNLYGIDPDNLDCRVILIKKKRQKASKSRQEIPFTQKNLRNAFEGKQSDVENQDSTTQNKEPVPREIL